MERAFGRCTINNMVLFTDLDGFIGRAADNAGVVELYTRHALGVTLERAHVAPTLQPVDAQSVPLREHSLPLKSKTCSVKYSTVVLCILVGVVGAAHDDGNHNGRVTHIGR